MFKAFTPGPPEALNYDYVISGGGAAFVANATYRAIPTKFFTIDQDNNRRDQDGKAW